jgi:hypothetical protein
MDMQTQNFDKHQ